MSYGFRQAKWGEPLIFELGLEGGRKTFEVDYDSAFIKEGEDVLKKLGYLARAEELKIPNLSEPEVIRHYLRLTQMSYGVDSGPVPLGSCTMKYNPKVCEELARDDRVVYAHPYLDEDDVQGILEAIYTLQEWLAELTGMDVCTIHPPAGAAGELTGVLIIRKYLEDLGMGFKDEMIVPESAHGTNPASAVMGGFKVISIPADERGNTDFEALKAAVNERTAGIMLTNPSTLGLFEERIRDIADLIHSSRGLLYYDGANLNGMLGIARPGDMGFDIVHLNLHKTFASPHGGGGPGGGVVCVKGFLSEYLPKPLVRKGGDGRYYLDYRVRHSVGRITWFYGNVVPALKSLIYLAMLGPLVREVAEIAVLNTNYLMRKLAKLPGVSLLYGEGRWRKHEVVVSFEKLLKDTGVSAEDVAKALLDRGIHAPTIYFPLIVPEAHMIELTECEGKETIDSIARAYEDIVKKAYEDPGEVKGSPTRTSVGRLDALKANHPKTMVPSYRWLVKHGTAGGPKRGGVASGE